MYNHIQSLKSRGKVLLREQDYVLENSYFDLKPNELYIENPVRIIESFIAVRTGRLVNAVYFPGDKIVQEEDVIIASRSFVEETVKPDILDLLKKIVVLEDKLDWFDKWRSEIALRDPGAAKDFGRIG